MHPLGGLLALLSAVASASTSTDVPLGELPRLATPQRYRISLTIFPGETTFRGHAEIDVALEHETQTLHVHGDGLHVESAALRTGGSSIPVTYREVDPSGVARLDFPRRVGPGVATLVFDYSATLREGANGLYRFKSAGAWHVCTQFQPTAARRAFPAFDEPAHKTPFEIDITTSPGLVVVSNAPLLSTEEIGERFVRHRFAPTAPLPTYLIAFAVGPFDVASVPLPPTRVRARRLELRAFAPKGRGQRLAYALRETPLILEQLEEYFGTPYPFEKLDVLASPAMGGGMENAGLITFRETLLLIDARASPQQRSAFAIAMAHELAHQWFGNLVTPRWWDDLWLSEAFAKWLATRTVHRWQPEFDALALALEETHQAMAIDSGSAAQPVLRRVENSSDIASAFDQITYFKGARVLAMFESYVGEETFRSAVRSYLEHFRFGTARAEDFIGSLQEATRRRDLSRAFRAFILQPGLPVVAIERDGARAALSQSRFHPRGATVAAPAEWDIPVCLRLNDVRQCTKLGRHPERVDLVDAHAVLIANANGAGYYRFSLPDAEWALLVQAVKEMPDSEALATLDSLWADYSAGRMPFERVLAAMANASLHASPRVARNLGVRIAELQDHVLGRGLRPLAQRLLIKTYGPRLEALGFSPEGFTAREEPESRRLLREMLVSLLAVSAREPELRTRLGVAARKLLAGDVDALDPAYRLAALVVLVQDSPANALPIFVQALTRSDDPTFRLDVARALGAVSKESGASVVLRLLDDGRLQNMEAIEIVRALLSDTETRAAALTWLQAHFDTVVARLPALGKFQIITIAGQACDLESGSELQRIFRPRLKALGGGERELADTIERIAICSAFKEQHGPEIERVLARTGAAPLPGLRE